MCFKPLIHELILKGGRRHYTNQIVTGIIDLLKDYCLRIRGK